jgi:hypothetical protein
MTNSTVTESVSAERRLRQKVRGSLGDWAKLALASQGFTPARHHKLIIEELEGLVAGRCDRLMLLLPPGSAKSTYTVLNVLLGTLGAMATSVVGYWVGSSAGSARKDARLATLADRG